MLCCCFVAEFRFVQFDSCDQQAFSEGLSPHRNTEEFLECKHVGCRADVFRNCTSSSGISWRVFGFCSCCGHPAMNCSTLSWCLEMCVTKLCFTVRCSRFLSKLTSIKMYKSLRGVNAPVFFLMCSLKASPISVPLGKQLVNEAVDPAELRSRETENGDVDLISRSRDVDDGVWFGLEKALDRTLSATDRVQKSDAEHCWPVQQ